MCWKAPHCTGEVLARSYDNIIEGSPPASFGIFWRPFSWSSIIVVEYSTHVIHYSFNRINTKRTKRLQSLQWALWWADKTALKSYSPQTALQRRQFKCFTTSCRWPNISEQIDPEKNLYYDPAADLTVLLSDIRASYPSKRRKATETRPSVRKGMVSTPGQLLISFLLSGRVVNSTERDEEPTIIPPPPKLEIIYPLAPAALAAIGLSDGSSETEIESFLIKFPRRLAQGEILHNLCGRQIIGWIRTLWWNVARRSTPRNTISWNTWSYAAQQCDPQNLFRTRSPTPSLYGTCEGRNVALALVFDVCQSKGECLLEARRHAIRSTWYSLDSWCSIRITHSLTSAKILAFTSAPVVRFIMKPSLMPFSSAPLLRAYWRLTSSGFDPASWMIIELFRLMAIWTRRISFFWMNVMVACLFQASSTGKWEVVTQSTGMRWRL